MGKLKALVVIVVIVAVIAALRWLFRKFSLLELGAGVFIIVSLLAGVGLLAYGARGGRNV